MASFLPPLMVLMTVPLMATALATTRFDPVGIAEILPKQTLNKLNAGGSLEWLHEEEEEPMVSRRNLLFRGALWTTGVYYGSGSIPSASAYTVNRVEPDEKETYAEAQRGKGPLRVLWVGSGPLDSRSGVFKNLFEAGNEVVALDLKRPDETDLRAATTYAAEHGYRLRFEQGDATKLQFADGFFDVVLSSMFLCQDFDPEVVVNEIRRVPEMINVIAGVVRKV